MPCKKEHENAGQLIGLLGGGLTYLAHVEKKRELEGVNTFNPLACALFLLSGATIGKYFGCLPDTLEPAVHSHHRDIMHSTCIAAGIIYGMKRTTQSTLPAISKGVINTAAAAYLTHLLMDAETSRGLPFLSKK